MKKIVLLLFFLAIVASIAWSPWVNKNFVKEKINNNQKNEGVLKGCTLEIFQSSKSPFGATAFVRYRCPQPINSEEKTTFEIQMAKLFVSPFGTVHYLSPLSP